MKRVLFVCTGNTCRSCMAEGIFNHLAAGGSGLHAESAGVAAQDMSPASAHSINVLKSLWGIDISSHRARMITRDAVKNSDLILTMTREHRRAVLSMFPEAAGKTFTLKEYSTGADAKHESDEYNFALDVTDPYGMPEQVYRKCAREIHDAVDRVVARLKE